MFARSYVFVPLYGSCWLWLQWITFLFQMIFKTQQTKSNKLHLICLWKQFYIFIFLLFMMLDNYFNSLFISVCCLGMHTVTLFYKVQTWLLVMREPSFSLDWVVRLSLAPCACYSSGKNERQMPQILSILTQGWHFKLKKNQVLVKFWRYIYSKMVFIGWLNQNSMRKVDLVTREVTHTEYVPAWKYARLLNVLDTDRVKSWQPFHRKGNIIVVNI